MGHGHRCSGVFWPHVGQAHPWWKRTVSDPMLPWKSARNQSIERLLQAVQKGITRQVTSCMLPRFPAVGRHENHRESAQRRDQGCPAYAGATLAAPSMASATCWAANAWRRWILPVHGFVKLATLMQQAERSVANCCSPCPEVTLMISVRTAAGRGSGQRHLVLNRVGQAPSPFGEPTTHGCSPSARHPACSTHWMIPASGPYPMPAGFRVSARPCGTGQKSGFEIDILSFTYELCTIYSTSTRVVERKIR